METIIGLLVVLLPIIFKLIGKNMEQAAAEHQHDTAGNTADIPVGDWKETVLRHLQQQLEERQEDVMPVQEEVCEPASDEAPLAVHKTRQKANPMQRTVPILQEEVKKKKEKIDTRKLIVYSEIMKPKYTE